MDAAIQAVDLAASSVTAPTTANVGQSITVNWQVTDQSSQATTGSWQDSVYISPTPTITSSSTLLGMVPQTATVQGGASYNASLTATLPAALAPGYYYVLVEVDSLYQLPDPNRANNTLAATTGQINIGLPSLTLGTPYADSFTAADQDHYYQITVPAGGSLNVALQSSASSGCRGPLRQPGDAAHALQLPGSGRDGQSAEPDGGRAAGAHRGHLLHPGPQRLRRGRHGRLHAHRHADGRRERVRHLALLGRQRRQRHRRDRRHQLHAGRHRQPDPRRHDHQRLGHRLRQRQPDVRHLQPWTGRPWATIP